MLANVWASELIFYLAVGRYPDSPRPWVVLTSASWFQCRKKSFC